MEAATILIVIVWQPANAASFSCLCEYPILNRMLRAFPPHRVPKISIQAPAAHPQVTPIPSPHAMGGSVPIGRMGAGKERREHSHCGSQGASCRYRRRYTET